MRGLKLDSSVAVSLPQASRKKVFFTVSGGAPAGSSSSAPRLVPPRRPSSSHAPRPSRMWHSLLSGPFFSSREDRAHRPLREDSQPPASTSCPSSSTPRHRLSRSRTKASPKALVAASSVRSLSWSGRCAGCRSKRGGAFEAWSCLRRSRGLRPPCRPGRRCCCGSCGRGSGGRAGAQQHRGPAEKLAAATGTPYVCGGRRVGSLRGKRRG